MGCKERQVLEAAVCTPGFHLLHVVKRNDSITFYLNGSRLGFVSRDTEHLFTEIVSIGNGLNGGQPLGILSDLKANPKP